MSTGPRPLLEQHVRLLEASAISGMVIDARGYRSVSTVGELEEMGFKGAQIRVPALVLPIHSVNGDIAFEQIRPDDPRIREGKSVKYDTPKGTAMAIDVHPMILERVKSIDEALLITEGVRKADAAISAGAVCIAIMGVWNWRGKNSCDGHTALGDWESIALKGRVVDIAFDSDTSSNQQVKMALLRFARFLKSRGAFVRIVHLTSLADGSKVGLDDYLANGGTLGELLETAIPLSVYEKSESVEAGTKPSVASRLLDLCKDIDLFHSADDFGYARIQSNGHFEAYKLQSKAFRDYLRSRFYSSFKSAVASAIIDEVIDTLEARARFEGDEHPVFIRIGRFAGKIYVDLGDKDWSTVEIDADGWRIRQECPIRFVRPKGMLALPLPRAGGSISDLRRFVNAASDEDFVLIAGFLVGAYMDPNSCTFPILVLTGEKGTAKSTTAKVLHRIIDPRKVDLKKLGSLDDLLLSASKARILALDNLGRLTPAQSDILCLLATGGGIAKRELYTNDDEFSIDAKLPVVLTGIEDIVNAQDLADRAIFPKLKFIRDEDRLPEREFWSDFESTLPLILGWVFSALASGIRNSGQLSFYRLPRMADFFKFVMEAEDSFDLYRGLFENALHANRKETNCAAIEDSEFGQAIVEIAQSKLGVAELSEFKTRATDLRNLIVDILPEKSAKGVPPTNRIRGEIRKLAGALRHIGIEIAERREGGARWILFRRLPGFTESVVTAVTSVTTNPEEKDVYDDRTGAHDDPKNNNDDLEARVLGSDVTHDDCDDIPEDSWLEASNL